MLYISENWNVSKCNVKLKKTLGYNTVCRECHIFIGYNTVCRECYIFIDL